MLIRYPDAPMTSSLAVLADLRETEWCAQFKMDGFRCIIQVGDYGCSFTSRHDKPLPLSRELHQQISGVLMANSHEGSIFDAEYMTPRRGQTGGGKAESESIVVFDLLRHGLDWVTMAPMLDRFLLLQDMIPHELIVAHTWTHYAEFFEASKMMSGVEGIVLKRADSKYIGSVRGSCDNPSWLKIRHKLPVSLKVA